MRFSNHYEVKRAMGLPAPHMWFCIPCKKKVPEIHEHDAEGLIRIEEQEKEFPLTYMEDRKKEMEVRFAHH